LRRFQLQNEHELNRQRIEQHRFVVEIEAQTKQHEIDARTTSSSSSVEQDTSHSFRKYELGIGKFENVSTSLEPFILKFEVVANAYKLPAEL